MQTIVGQNNSTIWSLVEAPLRIRHPQELKRPLSYPQSMDTRKNQRGEQIAGSLCWSACRIELYEHRCRTRAVRTIDTNKKFFVFLELA